MRSTKISYSSTGKFSRLIIDYLNNDEKLKSFFGNYPKMDGFLKQIKEKEAHDVDRKTLVSVLRLQNSSVSLSSSTKSNIELLADRNTFTITTGHQLCLFSGPLYVIYKIVSTINLCKKLSQYYKDKNFVPVFWLASEDHDFEEIKSTNVFKSKIEWNIRNKNEPVGRMTLEGMNDVLQQLKDVLGLDYSKTKITQVFNDAYLNCKTLSSATRYFLNEIFKQYGLVILDGDDSALKKKIAPIIRKDLIGESFYKSLKKCSQELSKIYHQQVKIRRNNFFIISKNGERKYPESKLTEEYIAENLTSFSPNVLMRPIYQETILPNIAYVGGSAEIAYLMQLKMVFEQESIPFPILVLRNSALLVSKKQSQKIDNLGLDIQNFFLPKEDIIKKFLNNNKIKITSLAKEHILLNDIFKLVLYQIKEDSLKSFTKSEFNKMFKSLKNIEKKIIRQEKKRHKESINRIENIKKTLFPNNMLQERFDNFISYELSTNDSFIELLIDHLDPLDTNFVILHT